MAQQSLNNEDYVGCLIADKHTGRWILGMVVRQTKKPDQYEVEWYNNDKNNIQYSFAYKHFYHRKDIERMRETYIQKIYARISQRSF